MKIDWKRKLTSRKFWAAVVGFVSQMLIAFNFCNVTVEKVAATIMAAAVLIAYIIGEGLIDAAHADDGDVYVALDTDKPESEDSAD